MPIDIGANGPGNVGTAEELIVTPANEDTGRFSPDWEMDRVHVRRVGPERSVRPIVPGPRWPVARARLMAPNGSSGGRADCFTVYPRKS